MSSRVVEDGRLMSAEPRAHPPQPGAIPWRALTRPLGWALAVALWSQFGPVLPARAQTTAAERDVRKIIGEPELPTETTEYIVLPGDVLKVSVWREPDLSGDVTVRLDGKITVPLLGDVDTRGRTPEEIATDITERLRQFVEEAHVTVGVAQSNSARFFVIGEVSRTGVFPLEGRTTVVQALALAGGFGTFAKRDKILLIRGSPTTDSNGKPNETVLRVNYKKITEGDTTQNFVLLPGDTVVVP